MKTAVLVPTYRTSNNAYSIIYNAFLLANDNCHVFIGDNSENKEKCKFLKELSEKNPAFHATIHKNNIGVHSNWYYLFGLSKSFDFVQFLSDDDVVIQDFLSPSIKLLSDRPDASAAAGSLLALHNNSNVSGENPILDDPDPVKRMESWFAPNLWNLHSYSLFRRSVFERWVTYTKDHPFKAAFFDFLLTIAMVCQGPVPRHSDGAYIWNSGNWGESDKNLKSKLSYYPKSLSEGGFGIFFDLHMAIECMVYVVGISSPVKDVNAVPHIAEIIWKRIISRFRDSVLTNESMYIQSCQGSEEIIKIIRIFFHSNSVPNKQQILSFCAIVGLYDQSIANEYYQHIDNNLRDSK